MSAKLIDGKAFAEGLIKRVGAAVSELNNRYNFKILITKYQTRFLQNNINGNIDRATYIFILKHFLSLILTKK